MMNMDQITSTYTNFERLGAGSGGVVYKAYHKRLQKNVILKRIINQSISEQNKRKEVDILKNLNHSYLPQVLDFLEIENEIFTVMSYIPGKSLQEHMNEGRKFTQKELIRFGMQLCSALNYLHSQVPPIIHSDVKPANIMLTPEEDICLIDFNISFFLNENVTLGYSSGYTSPEQYQFVMSRTTGGTVKIDERSDIYSLGATLYYLATGIKLTSHEKQIDMELLEGKTSEVFAEVIRDSMYIEPQKRYSNVFLMFKAFQNISKKDRRYQGVLRKQKLVTVVICISFLGFVCMTVAGIFTMKNEKYEAYNQLTAEQKESNENDDYENVEVLYQQAVEILPEELEAYYQKTYALFQQKEYEKCIDFIQNEIFLNEKLVQQYSRMEDVRHLKANAHYELEEYSTAVEEFEQAEEAGAINCEFYRDYAIALAYNQDSEKADEVLERAIDNGLLEDSIYYARGEISYTLQDYQVAKEAFVQCITCTDNEYMKMRAYVMQSKMLEEQNNYEADRKLLLEAKENLPVDQQLIIMEKLVTANLEIAAQTENPGYYQEAITVSKDIIENGWDTYLTYNNLAILYQKLEDVVSAKEILQIMQDKYGDDYNIFKRYAFLEVEQQEKRNNYNRDYSQFKDYYMQAEEMYYEQLKDNNMDAEMQLLENVYNQVNSGGW